MSIIFSYNLVLLEIGPDRLRVLAYLRELMKLSHSKIKARVANLPISVVNGNWEYIKSLAADLTALGAVVKLELTPETPASNRPLKELAVKIELDLVGAQASPGPPLGPALKPYGMNVGRFITDFNERTERWNGKPVHVFVSIFRDGSFNFVIDAPIE